jgi:uncharacterized low-complexity protein
MTSTRTGKSAIFLAGTAFLYALSASASSSIDTASAFVADGLDSGYQLAAKADAEGKCGEGKCGESKDTEGKCGEGKRGETKDAEGKCGEGKCGGAA